IQSSLNYRLDTASIGKFLFSADYYDALKHTYRQKDGDPTTNYLCCANSNEFKSRLSGSVTWNLGRFSSTLYGLRNGRTWNHIGTEKNIGPWTTFNATINYRATPHASISLVVNNLANKRPPSDPTYGDWPYFDVTDYNALGRAMYLEFGYDFGV
ncbi:MAG: TonB-dependent receptor, partial [Dyella sp.]